MDNLDFIMAWEAGEELDLIEILEGFSKLYKDGLMPGLQGHYQRTFMRLVELGYLSRSGDILWNPAYLEE